MSSTSESPLEPSFPSSASPDEGEPTTRRSERGDVVAAPTLAAADQSETLADAVSLDATRDARQIVRLMQCPICHLIIQHPTTLPCGYSICRACIPEPRPRANISWPATAGRLQGFDCPLPSCLKEHAVADCALDVTLNKVLTIAKAAVASYQSPTMLPELCTHIIIQEQWRAAGLASLEKKQYASTVLKGGRIFATYSLVELGQLEYNNEVSYSSIGAGEDDASKCDTKILLELKELVKTEMDCQVCFALFLDPITTTCGHTYCRACIHRVLDHSDLCPICRRAITIQAQADSHAAPSNGRLVSMIYGFWAELAALRYQAYMLEQQINNEGFDIPIFICTLSFPSMPLFLHVFEPRYRLMIRRAMEGDRTFGMVLGRSASGPGQSGFMELGVILRIVNIEFFPDGRSLLETVGVSRFRITRHGLLDGYVVANIEKVDDISLADEEALEASELSHESNTVVIDARNTADPESSTARLPSIANDLKSISTRDLTRFGVNFVRRMQAESVYWLAARMLAIYGDCPDDPATFPWWFACVFPVSDAEKYRLLATLSVRKRVKICYQWITEWEGNRWLVTVLSCLA
ncbi:putative ATP-dependent protease La domain-containing protein [Rosellinia necatrix]|uniref:Putative ATP-dependent protease La domain-containing protein n=1 Tax=Rosellinia necatrix TaxID=77044 RepID=A0A1W2TLN3_ROSNE|nr:putative ATP-dependent protease La domain-containing protein [Rosellinia necatrix]